MGREAAPDKAHTLLKLRPQRGRSPHDVHANCAGHCCKNAMSTLGPVDAGVGDADKQNDWTALAKERRFCIGWPRGFPRTF